MEARHHVTASKGDKQLHVFVAGVKEKLHACRELVHALARLCGHVDHIVAIEHVAQLCQNEWIGLVNLVNNDDLRRSFLAGFLHDVVDNLVHRFNLLERERVRPIDHVQHEICGEDFFQRGLEGFHQLSRQVAHEADGVGEDDLAAVGKLGSACGGIQRGEQGILNQHACARHRVDEGGLSSIGVAGNCDLRHGGTLTLRAFDLTGGLHRFEFFAQQRHLGTDAATVRLDLGFTRTTQAHTAVGTGTATCLARKIATPTTRVRVEVLQLRQGDLRLAFLGLRMLCKDVQNEHGAVNDLGVESTLEGRELAGGELTIADDGIGAGSGHNIFELCSLA